MVVVKLGGSLISDIDGLKNCLQTISQQQQVVIVPGGGIFADQVRLAQKICQFNDQTAHNMAVLAMQQMALLFHGFHPDFVLANSVLKINQALLKHSIVIWSADIDELNQAKVQASWNITSDSLAVWLADKLSASELILVKSSEILLDLTYQQMQQKGIIDQAFTEYTQNISFKIKFINKQSFNEHSFN